MAWDEHVFRDTFRNARLPEIYASTDLSLYYFYKLDPLVRSHLPFGYTLTSLWPPLGYLSFSRLAFAPLAYTFGQFYRTRRERRQNSRGESEIDVTKIAQVGQTTIGTPQHKLLTASHTCTDDLLPVSDTFLENYLSETVAKGTKYTMPVELV